ncbi:lipoprotein [Mycoplasma mycoides]|uniref:lipoprotein n=1 Tax=Mycoplasma mycoides TaxID=2102 RepID=UPI00223FBD23|nr:lipoprotein [Mycoplasma mycoides]QVK02799.1 lipoprotein [Mycoplasma mycoides subsp. capri]QVK03616.1 lipoprotein [Mycoplasma mycoides subsp. capri]
MKKLLTLLGSVGLVTTTSIAAIACTKKIQEINSNKKTEKEMLKPAEKSKEEEEKTRKESTKEEKGKTFPKQNLDLGVFPKNEDKYNSVSQSDIKKKLANELDIKEYELTDLDVNYDNNTGTVKSPKFSDTLNFKFSTILDLGEFTEKDRKTIPQSDIKKKLADSLKVNQQDLQELKTNFTDKDGTGTVKSPKFSGTISFKFTIKEQKNK